MHNETTEGEQTGRFYHIPTLTSCCFFTFGTVSMVTSCSKFCKWEKLAYKEKQKHLFNPQKSLYQIRKGESSNTY